MQLGRFATNMIRAVEIHDFIDNTDLDIINSVVNKNAYGVSTINTQSLFIQYQDEKPVRRSHHQWLDPWENKELMPFYQRLLERIKNINNEHFGFALTDIENLQYTRYDIDNYYGWHVDTASALDIGNTCRKLSFSIQITPPDSYQGGNLVLNTDGSHKIATRSFLSAIFFPSCMPHQVEPVTQGTRYSIVGWVSGPEWK